MEPGRSSALASATFLAPKSPLHLQFAYFESSLVVEFLVERYGMDALKKILNGLGEGMDLIHDDPPHRREVRQPSLLAQKDA